MMRRMSPVSLVYLLFVAVLFAALVWALENPTTCAQCVGCAGC